MFFRRLCAVGAMIVGGFAVSGCLIIGSLDQDRGGRGSGSILSMFFGPRGNGGIEGATPVADDSQGEPVPVPPLVDFPVVPASDAAPEVRDEDYVVGVEVDGEARAYPLNMLSRPSATSSTIPWAGGRSPSPGAGSASRRWSMSGRPPARRLFCSCPGACSARTWPSRTSRPAAAGRSCWARPWRGRSRESRSNSSRRSGPTGRPGGPSTPGRPC